MEFWAGDGQPPLYAKFGTVPGRNFAHAYQDKHQAADFQPYLCERLDRGREPSCWTVPGSRTGGVLQDYTNWTDQDLSPSAPHFPFALDNQPRQLHGLRDYQAQDKREREWLVVEAHRAAARERERECERRMQREGLQRRWEPCSPVRYRREPARRSLSDTSYRELEAWAARYSHSLPRKRRLEAGLWGAQGTQECERVLEKDSWGNRGGTEPRASAIHLAGLPQPREWGQWERRDTQKTMSHSLSQPVIPDTTYPSDTKENETSYQKRVFSQPPGYIPPPPYNATHNISTVMQHAEKYTTIKAVASVYAGWYQGASRHTYCTLPTPRKQDYSVLDFHRERGGGEKLMKEEWKQRTWSDPGGHRQQGHAIVGQWTGSSAHPQNIRSDSLSPLLQSPQQPQMANLCETANLSATMERKVSLKKSRGGETIFCLVSRMGGTAGLSSSPEEPLKLLYLPLSTTSPLTTVSNSVLGRVSRGLEECGEINESHKLAGEVDSVVPSLQHESSAPAQTPAYIRDSNLKPKLKGALDWMGSEQVAAHREELLRAIQSRPSLQGEERDRQSLPSTTDSEVALPEGTQVGASSPVSRRKGMQTLAPVSVKYPLWREPSYMGRVKSDNPSPCYLKATWEEGKPGKDLNDDHTENSPDVCSHPLDVEVRRLELKRDTESDSSSGLLVIDATCVVVRVEFIFPPKKEHVQYLCSPTPSDPPEPGLDQSSPIDLIPIHNQVKEDTSPEQSTDISAQICPLLDSEEPVIDFKELDVEEQVDKDQHTPSDTPFTETYLPQQTEDTRQLPESLSPSPSIPDNKTWEEHAGWILGIPLLSYSVLDQTEEDELPQPNNDNNDSLECLPKITLEEPVSEASPEIGQAKDDILVTEADVTLDAQSSADIVVEPKMEVREQTCDFSVQNPSDGLPDIQVMYLHKTDITNVPPFEHCLQVSQDAGEIGDAGFSPPISQCLNPQRSYPDSPPHSPLNTTSPSNSRSSSPSHHFLTSPSQFTSRSAPPESNTDPLYLPEEVPLSPSDISLPLHPDPPPTELSDYISLFQFPSPPPSLSVPLSPSRPPPPSVPPLPSRSPPPSPSVPLSPYRSPSPSLSVPLSPSRSPSVPLSPSRSPPPPGPSSRPQSPEILVKSFNPVLPSSTTPTTHREGPEYPKSLWDAVKFIRKHTAPDSENEEEEGGELWDPESAGEDGAALDEEFDLGMENMLFQCSDNLRQGIFFSSGGSSLEVANDLEVQRDHKEEHILVTDEERSEKEPSRPAEDDTLSCSSTDSHGSGETVIMRAEGESDSETETDEETDCEAEIISEEPDTNVEHCVTEGEEWSCIVVPKIYVVVEEEREDVRDREVRDTAEPCQNERYLSETQATTQQIEERDIVNSQKAGEGRSSEGEESRSLVNVTTSERFSGGAMGDEGQCGCVTVEGLEESDNGQHHNNGETVYSSQCTQVVESVEEMCSSDVASENILLDEKSCDSSLMEESSQEDIPCESSQ
ncbi:uncharacterized protein LOC121576011 [Coregonus clupeaformis]|uniref:uncharacterized protein LOC121576011 n=1 Tax=Coregonus clupeaformis TaxID=59861 RepID=UPI001E1C6E11|nr:uncharacterized protein LOC121576011 [Coregonus clupeaformis]